MLKQLPGYSGKDGDVSVGWRISRSRAENRDPGNRWVTLVSKERGNQCWKRQRENGNSKVMAGGVHVGKKFRNKMK
jgi:hypothetical protein